MIILSVYLFVGIIFAVSVIVYAYEYNEKFLKRMAKEYGLIIFFSVLVIFWLPIIVRALYEIYNECNEG